MSAPLARLRGVEKRFGPVAALAGADLTLRPGEVHGVLGENGAGKSTLLGVLGGTMRPDGGIVEVGGDAVTFSSPRHAWRAGIGLVHQHFTLVPALPVIENLALGERRRGGWLQLDLPELRARAEALAQRTGLSVPLDAPVAGLGVATRQRVEILKVLLRDPRVLALDEPTAVLRPDEVASLSDLLRALAAEGRAVVLVAHKLDEVLDVADRVTVLRAGRTVATAPRAEVDAAALARAMVGREVPAAAADGGARIPPGEVVASLSGVHHPGDSGGAALEAVDLDVRRGEIVGVAGVEGNGQRTLAQVLAARLRPTRGSVTLPQEVGFIPQDRTHEGAVPDFDLRENAALALGRTPRHRRGPWMRWGSIRARTVEMMRRLDVRAPGPGTPLRALSGGNQQRAIVARELAIADALLVAENPTRGLDVAATAFVHGELSRLAHGPEGPGVLLVSTDLDEVLALSDRVFVMVRGRLRSVPPGEATRAGVGALMLSADA